MLPFIDSTRYMANSLSNLVNKLSEGIHRIKCKFDTDDKKCQTCRFKHKCSNCFLKYKNFKADYRQKIDAKLKNDLLIHITFLRMMTISLVMIQINQKFLIIHAEY